jgi:hypothetical protein
MSQDRHKRLAIPCYSNVKELLQLSGDAFVCEIGSATDIQDDDATGRRGKRLPNMAASITGGERCVPIFTKIRLTSIAILLVISACSGPPWTLQESPSAITLRWYSDEMDSSVADGVAQTHCVATSKNAELVSYDQDGSAQIGRYRCR